MADYINTLKPGSYLRGETYRIIRFISSGGFGCTYEAEHVLLEKRVAIKEFFVKDFCNRDEATSHVTVGTQSKKGLVEKLRRKFIDEAKALCKLHHPGIVNAFDIFKENGTVYFVMDYIKGRSLQEIVHQEGPLSEERAIRYIRQIAEALQHVHNNNCLHLDIKPGNIMIDEADQPILIDFGAVKQYDEQDGENTSTLMGKTPGYAPLEQMGNDVVTFTPATDIYALGATLYKLLSGITPLSSTLLASGEKLNPLPDTISPMTINVVKAAMEISRKNRPQTLSDFLRRLSVNTENVNEETTLLVELADQFDLHLEMVQVPEGSFIMGESKLINDSDEGPTHKVTISSFYIGKNEVTQALWTTIMDSNPSQFKGNNLPVENVSWEDVHEFLCKLNARTGKSYRLPTEAEWEYAARGGNQKSNQRYSGSDNIDDVAWYGGNSKNRTHPVGTKNPNELGIFDMSGNVCEWCSDWFGFYDRASQRNPEGPLTGRYRILRGGSWNDTSKYCKVSFRNYDDPDFRGCTAGFRLALSL